MARKPKNNAPNANAQQPPRKRGLFGLIFLPFSMVFVVASYLAGSVIVSIVLEWGGMLFGLCDYDHAAHVLEQEFAYLGDNFTMTLFGISAEDAALRVIHFFQDGLIARPPAQIHVSPQELLSMRFWSQLTANWPFYRNAVVYVLMVTGIRCVIIVLSSLLFVLVGLVAAIDGLHLRELRKVGGGIEHAGVYHHAKALIPYTVGISPVLYLSWPSSINPNFILLPGMLLFYLAVLIGFSTFKKFI
jgi:integrating conjugative element membrane protein, PFL_4697 family